MPAELAADIIIPSALTDGSTRAVADDRDHLREGDRVLLVIEDDLKFARIMVTMAREKGFKAVVATRGDTGLALANELQPVAITLDIQLPGMDGWTVLDNLKRNPRTRHIPVHVISVVEKNARAISLGAFAYLEKPVSKDALDGAFQHIATYVERKVKLLLLVEDDLMQAGSIAELVGTGSDVDVTVVGSAAAALEALNERQYDCMIVDLVLPDTDGLTLLEQVRAEAKFRDLPIIVYTGKELSTDEERRLRRTAESVIAKTAPQSVERLMSDTSLFLHRVETTLPQRAREMIEHARAADVALNGRKVLVVDDDVRNIFAVTSVLEDQDMYVVHATSGRAGLEAIEANPDIDLVLMDIMMPELDGYETMRQIRANPQHKELPIIAVTAKALKEDRDRCIAAGASDYLPKPIEPARLLELMRLWAHARRTPEGQA